MPSTSPNANPWDLTPPRRPGTSDWNGCAKVDDQAYPPDPQTMPSAAEWNTMSLLLVAIGRVLPSLVLSITGSASQPAVAGYASAASAVVASPISGTTYGSFTIVRNGTGDVSITWAANTFPAPAAAPVANTNAGAGGSADAVAITNGVRVRTTNAAGAAVDSSFTVTVY